MSTYTGEREGEGERERDGDRERDRERETKQHIKFTLPHVSMY